VINNNKGGNSNKVVTKPGVRSVTQLNEPAQTVQNVAVLKSESTLEKINS
jgi:hypothetical protein